MGCGRGAMADRILRARPALPLAVAAAQEGTDHRAEDHMVGPPRRLRQRPRKGANLLGRPWAAIAGGLLAVGVAMVTWKLWPPPPAEEARRPSAEAAPQSPAVVDPPHPAEERDQLAR